MFFLIRIFRVIPVEDIVPGCCYYAAHPASYQVMKTPAGYVFSTTKTHAAGVIPYSIS